MAPGLEAIAWQQPWLAPLRSTGEALARQCAQGARVWEGLNAAGPALVQFVPQCQLPNGVAYEHYIFESGCCPTREGLHDFFNGLCWLHFPLTKRRLNHLQADQIARSGIQPVRGAVRDALTVFDENAAFFQGPPALWQALQAKDWQALFVDMRGLWANARLTLFGHALMEKLVSPRKGITAHVYYAQTAIDSIAKLDAWMATDLSAEKLAAKPFAHLPVLGVPGWWHANEALNFYDDPAVFRLPRARADRH